MGDHFCDGVKTGGEGNYGGFFESNGGMRNH